MPASSGADVATRASCPKCGFWQPSGAVCRRCGIILFDRYRLPDTLPQRLMVAYQETAPKPFRWDQPWIRWAMVAGIAAMMSACLAGLVPMPTPVIRTNQLVEEEIAEKLRQVEQAKTASRPSQLVLDEAELNRLVPTTLGRR